MRKIIAVTAALAFALSVASIAQAADLPTTNLSWTTNSVAKAKSKQCRDDKGKLTACPTTPVKGADGKCRDSKGKLVTCVDKAKTPEKAAPTAKAASAEKVAPAAKTPAAAP